MTDFERRRRQYVRDRLLELVAHDAPLTRRAHTLSVRAAVDEVLALLDAQLRAASRAPDGAAYGILMLPNIVDEALDLVLGDLVLRDTALVGPASAAGAVPPSMSEALRDALGRVRTKEDVGAAKVEHLRALNNVLHRLYVQTLFGRVRELFAGHAKNLIDLGTLCAQLVADVRSRAWSDRALVDIFGRLDPSLPDPEFLIALDNIGAQLVARPLTYTCLVHVHLRLPHALQLPPELKLVARPENLPPRMSMRGEFAEIVVEANDRFSAAELAYVRVSAVIQSIRVFLGEQEAAVRGRTVVILGHGSLHTVDVQPRIPPTARRASAGQIARIARSALELARRDENDAVFDAVRHLQRAREAEHPESRFILLWSGIELLVNESWDHSSTLAAARALVPPAITLAKIRREVQELATRLATVFNSPDDESAKRRRELLMHFGATLDAPHPDAVRVLRWLLTQDDAEWRAPLAPIYDDHPLLVMWCNRLRDALKHGEPGAILAYVDAAHQRLERQMLRLYRARNSIAHAGVSPSWLGDLSLHASHYLSDLVAVCLHARETDPARPAPEILAERAGHYSAWRRLLVDRLPIAVQPEYLFRPTMLVGAHAQSHDDGT